MVAVTTIPMRPIEPRGPGANRRCRLWKRGFAAAAVIGLPGCINAYYQAPRTAVDERVYASFYPYFAEYCAVSEFNKKQGYGVELEGGGPGGHSVFYLNGACRVRDAGYPVLALSASMIITRTPIGRLPRDATFSITVRSHRAKG
jgi:hypothetical protein